MAKPKYNQLDKKDKADALSIQVRDAFEVMTELLKLSSQSELYEGSDKDFKLYYRDKQNHLSAFKREVSNIVSGNVKNLKKEVKSNLKTIGVSNKEVNKIANDLEAKANTLGNVFFRQHNQWMNQIKTTHEFRKKDIYTINTLHADISKVFSTNPTIRNLKVDMKDKKGNVRYRKDGTPMQEKYESYIERTVRTEIHSQIGKNLVRAGKSLGQVFYICSYFGDSRKEHADLQGKYYYDRNWESYVEDDNIKQQIQDYINEHNLMTIQEAQSDDVGLSTWCNCRHYFDFVDIDTVLSTKTDSYLEKVRDEYNMNQNGDYEEAKNDALNKQRYYERGIREWKNRLDEAKLTYSTLPDDAPAEERIKAYNELMLAQTKVKEWQKHQREHIKATNNKYGGTLSRDYKRENPNDIYDLGVKKYVLPPTPSPEEIKEEVENVAENQQLQIEVDSSMNYMDSKVKESTINRVVDLTNRFSFMKKYAIEHNMKLSCKKLKAGTNAQCGGRATRENPFNDISFEFSINTFKDESKLTKSVEKSVDSKWHMPCKEDNYSVYITTHEYGHSVSFVLLRDYIDKHNEEWLQAKQKEIDYLGKYYKSTTKYSDKILQQGLGEMLKEIKNIAKENNPNFKMSDNISRYGMTNYDEAFAEIFANSQCGNPNELGKAMNEWLEVKDNDYK